MTKTSSRNKFRTALCMILIMMWVMATAIPAMAAPRVKEAHYQGYGKVEVDFSSDVKFKNVKVTLKDNKGAKYSATNIKRIDSDEMVFTIKNYKKGRTYTYTISGVKRSSDKNYGTVKGTIQIPAATQAPKVKEVDYDSDDLEVEIEFKSYVQFKNPKVTVTTNKKNYAVRIVKKGNDSITVKVRKLSLGRKYNFTVSGIRVKGNTTYTRVKGSFVARDN